MAKFSVVFEDTDEGVSVKVVSDIEFPTVMTEEFIDSLTEAEMMGLKVMELINAQDSHEGCCGHGECSHDCGNCDGECKHV